MKSTEVLNPWHSARVICGYAKLSIRLCVCYPASIVPYKSKMAAVLCVEGEGRTARSNTRYKGTCPKQHEELSDVLQGVPSSEKPKRDVANANSENATATDSKMASRSTCSMTVEAAGNCCQKNSMCPLLNITNCHSVIVNYHLKP